MAESSESAPPVASESELTVEARRVAHFWVCSSPFFETALISALSADGNSGSPAQLRFFDADGQLVNEVSIEAQPGQVSVLELDPLMGPCKFQSGLRHAHLEIDTPVRLVHQCRIHSGEGASMLGELVPVFNTRRVFVPLVFSASSSATVVLVNLGAEEAQVRGRLFCGTRSPEAVWTVAPRAVRLVNAGVEFAAYYEAGAEKRVQAYLRLGVRGDYQVGVQLVDRCSGSKEGNYFTGLS